MADIVSVAEIAQRLGKARQTVKGWSLDGKLPPPKYGIVSRIPLWEWADIEQWAKDTGRI